MKKNLKANPKLNQASSGAPKIGKVMAALMEECKVKAKDLSQYTNVPTPTISRLLNDEEANPRLSTLLPIAEFFNVTLDQLMGIESLANREKGVFNPQARQSRRIPLIEIEEIEEFTASPESFINDKENYWVYVSINNDAVAFAIKLKGSMAANFLQEGTILIFDRDLTPSDRDYALIKIEGSQKIVLRQILIDGDDVYLKPLNPDFKDIQVGKNFKCYGVNVQSLINHQQ